MRKLPPLRALQAFEAFGRLNSATAAADELGVTVGAISQQLRKAEEMTGLRLLERRGKSISLTSQGRQYHGDIKAAFDLLRLAHARIEQQHSEAVLTISCLPSLAAKWLGTQLFDWQKAHPLASVRLIGDDAEPNLHDHAVDFRLSYGQMITRHDHRIELFTDWVVPACAPGVAAGLRLDKPADVLKAPLLGIEWAREQGAAPTWGDWAAHIGAKPPDSGGELAFSMSSAAIDAAVNGRGFVLAQWSMAADDIRAGRLVVPFDIRLTLPHPYALAWDPAVLDRPFGAELQGWLQAVARRQRSTPATAT